VKTKPIFGRAVRARGAAATAIGKPALPAATRGTGKAEEIPSRTAGRRECQTKPISQWAILGRPTAGKWVASSGGGEGKGRRRVFVPLGRGVAKKIESSGNFGVDIMVK